MVGKSGLIENPVISLDFDFDLGFVKRCSTDLYRAFMESQLETWKKSEHANDDLLIAVEVMLKLLDD